MTEISPNGRSLASLEAFALAGSSAFGENAAELFALISSPTPGWFTKDQQLALNLKKAWASLYGVDTSAWPVALQEAFQSIRRSTGLVSFTNDLTASLQSLQLFDETVPAFEVAVAVVRGFSTSPLVGEGWGEGDSIIPGPAARAGLSFISNPAALILPIYGGSMLGRFAQGLFGRVGVALGLAGEAGGALAEVGGLFAEATGFVATGNVVAPFMGLDSPMDRATTIEQIGSSTIFFGILRLFGAETRLIASLFPATETGIAVAKLIGHGGSIVGLAATEGLQENMGLAPATSATAEERLWRAVFLHATLSATRGVIGDIAGADNRNAEILQRASEWVDALRASVVVAELALPNARSERFPASQQTSDRLRQQVMLRTGNGDEGAGEGEGWSLETRLNWARNKLNVLTKEGYKLPDGLFDDSDIEIIYSSLDMWALNLRDLGRTPTVLTDILFNMADRYAPNTFKQIWERYSDIKRRIKAFGFSPSIDADLKRIHEEVQSDGWAVRELHEMMLYIEKAQIAVLEVIIVKGQEAIDGAIEPPEFKAWVEAHSQLQKYVSYIKSLLKGYDRFINRQP